MPSRLKPRQKIEREVREAFDCLNLEPMKLRSRSAQRGKRRKSETERANDQGSMVEKQNE